MRDEDVTENMLVRMVDSLRILRVASSEPRNGVWILENSALGVSQSRAAFFEPFEP